MMRTLHHYLALLMLMAIVLSAGCTTPPMQNPSAIDAKTVLPAVTPKPKPVPLPTPVQVPPHAPSDTDKLIAYFESLHKLSAAELGREHEDARQTYTRNRTDYGRVRYAMLLSMAGTPFYDDARALEVLDPLIKNRDLALHGLAYVISVQVQEQRQGRGLQQKLDALKSLDKNLIERNQGGG